MFSKEYEHIHIKYLDNPNQNVFSLILTNEHTIPKEINK